MPKLVVKTMRPECVVQSPTSRAVASALSNAQTNARQYMAPGSGNRDKSAYLMAIDGLPFGEDPSEGFVRGRRFLLAGHQVPVGAEREQ